MSPLERGRRHKSCLDDFDDHRAILSNALGAFPQQLQFRTRPRPAKPRPMARCAPALVAAMACGAAVVSSAACRRAAFLIGAAAGTPPDTRFLGAVATGPFPPSSASSFPPPALALCIIQDARRSAIAFVIATVQKIQIGSFTSASVRIGVGVHGAEELHLQSGAHPSAQLC